MVTISYARHSSTDVQHISEVLAPGLKCDCVCLECGWKLEAVNAFNPDAIVEPHFRHHRSEDQDVYRCIARATSAALQRLASDLHWLDVPGITIRSAEYVMGRRFVGEATAEAERLEFTSAAVLGDAALLMGLADGRELVILLGDYSPGLPATAGIIQSALPPEYIASLRPSVAVEKMRASSLRWVRHWAAPALEKLCAARMQEDSVSWREEEGRLAQERDQRMADRIKVAKAASRFRVARPAPAPVSRIPQGLVTGGKSVYIWERGGPKEKVYARMHAASQDMESKGHKVWPMLSSAESEALPGSRANLWMREAIGKFSLPPDVILEALLAARIIRRG